MTAQITHSRRSLFALASALAVTAAVVAPKQAIASPSVVPDAPAVPPALEAAHQSAASGESLQPATADPIFAAIEAHKAATVAVAAINHEHVLLERVAIHGRHGAEHDRKLDEAEERMNAAFDVQSDAACALICTEATPTTMAGVMALLQYAISADTDGEMWPVDLCIDDNGKSRERTWHHFLIEMLAEVLPGLAVQS